MNNMYPQASWGGTPFSGPKEIDLSNATTGVVLTSWGCFERKELFNGLKVNLVHFPRSHSLAAHLVVKSGSRADGPAEQGIAHFVEHMKFTGADEARQADQAQQERVMYWGATSPFYTVFTANGALPQASSMFGRLRDFAAMNRFDERLIEREKKVVTAELIERSSRPIDYIRNLESQRALMEAIGVTYPTLGTSKSIGEFTAAKAETFAGSHYRPDNMELILVGNLYEFDVERAVAESFGTLRRPGNPHQPQPQVRKFDGERQLKTDHLPLPVPGVHYRAASQVEFHGPLDRCALEVLQKALVFSGSSLLFKAMRIEQGLHYSVRMHTDQLSSKLGFSSIEAVVANPKDVNMSLEILDRTLARIAAHGLPESKLKLAKEDAAKAIPTFETGVADLLTASLGKTGTPVLPDQLSAATYDVSQKEIKAIAAQLRRFHVAAAGDVKEGEISFPAGSETPPPWDPEPRMRRGFRPRRDLNLGFGFRLIKD